MFPQSTQYITQGAPISGSPYGRNLMSFSMNPLGSLDNAKYNIAEANAVYFMQSTGDDGNGFYNRSFYNLMGNYGSMLNGGTNNYTFYPQEPYQFGFFPVGHPYGLNTRYGAGIPVMYNQGNMLGSLRNA